MTERFDRLKETPSQTAGPYVHIGLAPAAAGLERHPRQLGEMIAGPGAKGERIRVEGVILDGTGAPVKDALIEVWQADAEGRYPEPAGAGETSAPAGWGRVVPDFETGEWGFDTVKPGPVPGPEGRMMAPHISFWIVARGINVGLQTRLYFGDEPELNAADPVLALIEAETRRATLIARRQPGSGTPLYRFDIRLQCGAETVFFDI
ncbi:protocatechuate 3,4-dioxygenase subunit alpha [Cribrihabitans neustonicus]|uniref:protocatechuate 3,4-dioxygenase subunit alpha n=1 Tax=Cribrihabitans neustonicus TaxID=1429085 RepID=UPI003B5C2219